MKALYHLKKILMTRIISLLHIKRKKNTTNSFEFSDEYRASFTKLDDSMQILKEIMRVCEQQKYNELV